MDNSQHQKFGEFIRARLPHLAGNTLVDENFLDILLKAKCLSATGRDRILTEKVKYTRSSNFYTEEVVKRGPSTLSHIIDALRQTEQNTLADDLEKEGCEFLDNISSSSSTTNSSVQNSDARKLSFKQTSNASSSEPSTSTTVSPAQPSPTKKLLKFRFPCGSESNPNADLYASGILTKYRIDSTPRGYALIINIIQFNTDTNTFRDGAKHDSEQLGQLLTDFGYAVCPIEDLSSKESNLSTFDFRFTHITKSSSDHTNDFFEVIDEFLENFKENPVDSCIVSIMTHGDHEDLIMTSDRALISVKQILEKFNNVNCPQLNGKPKIFFMQHCRGDQTDKGASTVVFDAIPKLAPPEHGRLITVPTWTDMLVCYSTLEGYYSFREKDKGTWFIQILCEVFRKYSKKLDICKLLNLVAKEMMGRRTGPVQTSESFAETGLKQICPYYNIGFTSDFYFQTQS